MGADLCGYILVGSPDLGASVITEAREEAKRRYDVLQRCLESKDRDKLKQEIQAWDSSSGAFYGDTPVSSEYVWGAVEAGLDLADLTPERLVEVFAEMWNGENELRDVMRRSWAMGEYQILVAGAPTWGEGPEYGSGWWLCAKVDGLGLFPVLGID